MEYIILAIWLYCVLFSCAGLFAVRTCYQVAKEATDTVKEAIQIIKTEGKGK